MILQAPKSINEYKKFKHFYLLLIVLTLLLLIGSSSFWWACGYNTIKNDKSAITNSAFFYCGIIFFILFVLVLIVVCFVIPVIYQNNKIKYQKTNEFEEIRIKFLEKKYNPSIDKRTIKIWFKLGYINREKYHQLLSEKYKTK